MITTILLLKYYETLLLEEGAVALSHDGARSPRVARARRAANAMDVGGHLGGELEVDHRGDS